MSTSHHTPRQPWLHLLDVAVHGPSTALSDDLGDIHREGHGFFVDDVRVVSRLHIELDGSDLSRVASASSGNVSEFLFSARQLGDKGPDPSVDVLRRRELTDAGAEETITIRSRAAEPVQTTLTMHLGADGADIAHVKHGLPRGEPVAMSLTEDRVRWDVPRHRCQATWVPSPTVVEPTADGVHAVFPMTIEPGGAHSVRLSIRHRRTAVSVLDADAAAERLHLSSTFAARSDDPRVGRLISSALRDVEHLAMSDPLDPDDVFLGAGTPWYLTLFGRDSLWAARMLLPLGTDLALGTLRTLARRQGTKVDAAIAEQPGKIPHEVRRAVNPAHRLPPVYYGTVDATALWICLLGEARAWGLADTQIRELLPALRAALSWLLDYAAPDRDGLVKYLDDTGSGLANQGWKDSGDPIRFRDGRIATGPIALVEAQAYAVEAALATAAILRDLGDGGSDLELATAAADFAAALTARIRSRFWVGPDSNYRWLAIAVDGAGQPVDGIASNMGHALGTGALTEPEARRVADLLTAPNMLGNNGIRTLAADNGGYNPLGYHTGSVWTHDTAICAAGLAKEGLTGAADLVVRAMLDAAEAFDYRMPELHADAGVLGRPAPYPASCRPQAWSATAAVAMVIAGLAISCDAPRRTFRIGNPRSPFGAIRLTGIRVDDNSVEVSVDESGAVDVRGLPDDFEVLSG